MTLGISLVILTVLLTIAILAVIVSYSVQVIRRYKMIRKQDTTGLTNETNSDMENPRPAKPGD